MAEVAERHAKSVAPPNARAQRIIAVWNDRARRGKPAEYFPTFATALAAHCWRVTYCCPGCRQMGSADLRQYADAHHPRAPISALIPKLSCERCCPNPPLATLIELGDPHSPEPRPEFEQVEHQPATQRANPLPPIPTMEDMPKHGITHVGVWCGQWPHACFFTEIIPVEEIDLRLTIVEFASQLVCKKCGTMGGHASPLWPDRGGGPGGAHNHGGKTPAAPPSDAGKAS
ncbi:MAG: hypothetical protein Q8M24_14685 [Pseudolabrys sp.]|nr:hypothetical protein [Pseudolabrys sp.]MDP2296693.1 hypothetical protein [Pseudolabrys sp.]